MKKHDQIKFFKNQLNSSITMKKVAEQNYVLAAQLESEAKSALELLGAKPERTRKGCNILSDKTKLELVSSLTKDALFNLTAPIK